MPERFNRLLVMNVVLGLGGGNLMKKSMLRDCTGPQPDYDIAALFQKYVPEVHDDIAKAPLLSLTLDIGRACQHVPVTDRPFRRTWKVLMYRDEQQHVGTTNGLATASWPLDRQTF